jgi:hypothetical protein
MLANFFVGVVDTVIDELRVLAVALAAVLLFFVCSGAMFYGWMFWGNDDEKVEEPKCQTVARRAPVEAANHLGCFYYSAW